MTIKCDKHVFFFFGYFCFSFIKISSFMFLKVLVTLTLWISYERGDCFTQRAKLMRGWEEVSISLDEDECSFGSCLQQCFSFGFDSRYNFSFPKCSRSSIIRNVLLLL